MAEISAGPQRPPVNREAFERKLRADLWSAVWEASQILSADQIRAVVEDTLIEIAADEP